MEEKFISGSTELKEVRALAFGDLEDPRKLESSRLYEVQVKSKGAWLGLILGGPMELEEAKFQLMQEGTFADDGPVTSWQTLETLESIKEDVAVRIDAATNAVQLRQVLAKARAVCGALKKAAKEPKAPP